MLKLVEKAATYIVAGALFVAVNSLILAIFNTTSVFRMGFVTQDDMIIWAIVGSLQFIIAVIFAACREYLKGTSDYDLNSIVICTGPLFILALLTHPLNYWVVNNMPCFVC